MTLFFCALAVILLGAGCAGDANEPLSVNPEVQVEEAVLDLLKEDGQHEIWISFRAPDVDIKSDLEQWKDEIAATADAIIACGGIDERQVVQRYGTIPQLILDLTAEQIAQVSWCPDVEAVGVLPGFQAM